MCIYIYINFIYIWCFLLGVLESIPTSLLPMDPQPKSSIKLTIYQSTNKKNVKQKQKLQKVQNKHHHQHPSALVTLGFSQRSHLLGAWVPSAPAQPPAPRGRRLRAPSGSPWRTWSRCITNKYEELGLWTAKKLFSPPVRRGLLDFKSTGPPPPTPPSSAGPEQQPLDQSVPCRTSTTKNLRRYTR